MSIEQSPDTDVVGWQPIADGRDEAFRQSLAELSRQLAGRSPIPPWPFDPKIEGELTVQPIERTRRHTQIALLTFALGVAIGWIVLAIVDPNAFPA